MNELRHIDMERLGTFVNRAGRAFRSYLPELTGAYAIRVPEYLGEDAPFSVRDVCIGYVPGTADADATVHELNRYITATKKLLGV